MLEPEAPAARLKTGSVDEFWAISVPAWKTWMLFCSIPHPELPIKHDGVPGIQTESLNAIPNRRSLARPTSDKDRRMLAEDVVTFGMICGTLLL